VKKIQAYLLSAIISLLTGNLSRGQIAAWEFNSNKGNEISVTSSVLDEHLNTTEIKRSGSLSASQLANAFSSLNFSLSTSFYDTLTAKSYLQFTISAQAGYRVSLRAINANFRRSSSGPTFFQWQYSLNNFSTPGINLGDKISFTSTATNGVVQPQIDLSSISDLQKLSSFTIITFRLFCFGATSSAGTFALGRLAGNDLAIEGTVTSEVNGLPTMLVVASINNGSSPSANTPFDVVISSVDNSGIFQPVTDSTFVALSLFIGSGSLDGKLVDVIPAGSCSVTISGVTYDKAEAGVSITAFTIDGDMLIDGLSSFFTVLDAASQLTFVGLPASGQKNQKLFPFTIEARREDNSLDSNFTGDITLAVISGAGDISGAFIKSALLGSASFDDIKFDDGGEYTIAALSTGLRTALSNPINLLSTSLPLSEDFNYTVGTTLSFDGWVPNSSPGVNPILVSPGALTYPGYNSPATGNKASIGNSGEDLFRSFDKVISGAVYAAFLVNVSAAKTGGYFLTLSSNSTSSYYARIFAKDDGRGNLLFGIAKTDSVIYAAKIFRYNTTHLIVIKYLFNPLTSDDMAGIYIDPNIPCSEPSAFDALGFPEETDAKEIGYIILRQGNASNAPVLALDGIRISTSWESIPLPVELLSFTCKIISNNIHLNWSTANEINNFGFDVERSLKDKNNNVKKWIKISFIQGYGNSNSIRYYSYIDDSAVPGEIYFYRLRQIDNNGSFKYSNIIEAKTNILNVFCLYQNYPNPFNPVTIISFSLPEYSFVTLKLFNVLGKEVSTILNEYRNAGIHKIIFNADNLSSGVYLYKLIAGKHIIIKKMILLR